LEGMLPMVFHPLSLKYSFDIDLAIIDQKWLN
jgi:hypothetical protein